MRHWLRARSKFAQGMTGPLQPHIKPAKFWGLRPDKRRHDGADAINQGGLFHTDALQDD
jgi:hypothetical protein